MKSLFFFYLFGLTIFGIAQDSNLGIKVGYNLSKLTGYNRFDYTPLSSFQGGIVYSKPLSD
jgi:hypothetical protein